MPANQAKPTPGPWSYTGIEDGDFVVWSGEEYIANIGDSPVSAVSLDPANELVAFDITKANAEFIVRACNSHEALLEALIQAKLQIEYLHDKFQETSSGKGVIARIEYVIQSAEKGQL